MKPAGFENWQGIISSIYLKDPTDLQWKDDPAVKSWNVFLDKYYPEANRTDASVMYAYIVAQGLVHVLKNCGNDLHPREYHEAGCKHERLRAGRAAAGRQG